MGFGETRDGFSILVTAPAISAESACTLGPELADYLTHVVQIETDPSLSNQTLEEIHFDHQPESGAITASLLYASDNCSTAQIEASGSTELRDLVRAFRKEAVGGEAIASSLKKIAPLRDLLALDEKTRDTFAGVNFGDADSIEDTVEVVERYMTLAENYRRSVEDPKLDPKIAFRRVRTFLDRIAPAAILSAETAYYSKLNGRRNQSEAVRQYGSFRGRHNALVDELDELRARLWASLVRDKA